MTLAELRKNYSHGGLSEAEAGDDPFALFRAWIEQAIASPMPEPNAFILATADAHAIPSARMILLKALDDRGFTFFTNYDSRKANEITANPRVAMVFPWNAIERQVRIEGTVELVSAAESDDYFAQRPLGSRLGAWASPQSSVIPDREFLERRHAELMRQYPDGNVPRPPNWGGYRVLPVAIEFWQGRPSRLHDRILFSRQGGGWKKKRLSP